MKKLLQNQHDLILKRYDYQMAACVAFFAFGNTATICWSVQQFAGMVVCIVVGVGLVSYLYFKATCISRAINEINQKFENRNNEVWAKLKKKKTHKLNYSFFRQSNCVAEK